MKWYFTFGYGDEKLRNKYIVYEGTFGEARDKMFLRFGSHWAFQYSEKEFEGQAEKYGLTELE